MNILVEAHGSAPSAHNLLGDTPRIAFVNSDSLASYLIPQRIDDRLLVVAADDMDVPVIARWMRVLLGLPSVVSYRVKRHAWRSALSSGFPSAPLAMGDAEAVLAFYASLKAQECQELIISCEYGKSRSVTTARFLRVLAENGLADDLSRAPNTWFDYLLNRAQQKRLAYPTS